MSKEIADEMMFTDQEISVKSEKLNNYHLKPWKIIIADDEKEVADEIAELVEEGKDTITFEHEIALQCCADCDVEDESN